MTDDMHASLGSLTIGTLFNQASSINPVPGGGCVSAVCGYLAVSILLKSIRVSARAHTEDSSLSDIDRQLTILSSQLLGLAQADSDSFNIYMQAVKMPKTTEQEIAARQTAMHEAAVGATVSALNILDVGNRVLDIAHHVQDRVSAPIRPDEKSGVEIISAMNSTAEWNAAANLGSLRGEAALAKRLGDGKERHATLLAACHSG